MIEKEYDEIEERFTNYGVVRTYLGDVPFTGRAIERADWGIQEVTEYKYGFKHGLDKYWIDEGVLEQEFHYKFGVLHGPARVFYQNGKLNSESFSQFGVKIWHKRFDEAGNVTFEEKREIDPEDDPEVLKAKKTLLEAWERFAEELSGTTEKLDGII